MVGLNLIDWWFTIPVQAPYYYFGTLQRFANYLLASGYIEPEAQNFTSEGVYNTLQISSISPIVDLYNPDVTAKCNYFHFKNSYFDWYDYVIVGSSAACVIIGLIYFLVTFLENRKIVPELVLLKIKNKTCRKIFRELLSLGNIDACDCDTVPDDSNRHSKKCPLYADALYSIRFNTNFSRKKAKKRKPFFSVNQSVRHTIAINLNHAKKSSSETVNNIRSSLGFKKSVDSGGIDSGRSTIFSLRPDKTLVNLPSITE